MNGSIPSRNDLKVRSLAPSEGEFELSGLLGRKWPPQEPFSLSRREALASLSQDILRDELLRRDPASVALGYWLRRANLERLAGEFRAQSSLRKDVVYVPSGRVFHIAPSNVDTVFLYSWAVAYLCGNANIVRVPSDRTAILERLLAVVGARMATDHEMCEVNSFLNYGHDDAISTELSKWCTHRILWGGNETVAYFRALPMRADASERAFASKYSYAMISAKSYCSAPREIVATLAQGFFHDVFSFQQMGCSSPHSVIWVGSEREYEEGTTRFNGALRQEITRRGFRGPASTATHRLRYAFDLACQAEVQFDPYEHEFLALTLRDRSRLDKTICGAGLFTHVRANNLAEVASMVEEGDQTVTHYGFYEKELHLFARAAGTAGIDRVVPIGEALAFNPIWDGYDLVADCLRRVHVKSALPGEDWDLNPTYVEGETFSDIKSLAGAEAQSKGRGAACK